MTGLDPDLPSPPYQCGRMFAVLEDIQRAALGGTSTPPSPTSTSPPRPRPRWRS